MCLKCRLELAQLTDSKEYRAKQRQTEVSLERDILTIEQKLEGSDLSDDDRVKTFTELALLKERLELLISYKSQGSIIRSKTRWYNEGEKNTKYFLGLEKRHYNSKTTRNLKLDEDTILNSDQEILNEAMRFYQELYASKTNCCQGHAFDNIFFPEGNDCNINDIEREQCEGPLTAAECLESLKTMDSNKSPGTDGIPADFYKLFWNDIKPFFLASITTSFEKGLLSISQRRGLITLIPKKDQPKFYIKNP